MELEINKTNISKESSDSPETKSSCVFGIPLLDNYLMNYLNPLTDGITLMKTNSHYNDYYQNNEIISEAETISTVFSEEQYWMHFSRACEEGHLNLARHVFYANIENDELYRKDIPKNLPASFHSARQNGHLNVVKWLYDLMKKNEIRIDIFDDENNFKFACSKNHLDIAKWLFNKNITEKDNNDISLAPIITYANSKGYIDLVKWLMEVNDKYTSIEHLPVSYLFLFRNACIKGQYEIAKWLFESRKDKFIELLIKLKEPVVTDIAIECYKKGHLGTLTWLFELMEKLGTSLSTDIIEEHKFSSIINACETNNIEMIEWISSKGIIEQRFLDYGIVTACQYDHPEIADWIISYNHKNDLPSSFNDDMCDQLLSIAAREGHFRIIKWLIKMIDQFNIKINIKQEHMRIVLLACEHHNNDTIKWLFSHIDGHLAHELKIDTPLSHQEFLRFCKENNLEASKLLLDIGILVKDMDSYNYDNFFEPAFLSSCKHNNRDMFDKLVDFCSKICSKSELGHYFQSVFIFSCKLGNLDFCEYIFDVSARNECPIDIHADGELAFKMACDNNNLDVSKWLIKMSSNTPIDIRFSNDIIFVMSCQYGHLEIAKWLVSLNRDIAKRENRERALVMARANGKTHILKWLLKIGK